MIQAPGVDLIKLFRPKFTLTLLCKLDHCINIIFVEKKCKNFQPCMFKGKAGAYLSEASFRCSALGIGSWAYKQTLE
jgi:hypothetical protein